jgi:EAL domain-containing protein (putative c-di-GMP-specific phosphodiesterase class I)
VLGFEVGDALLKQVGQRLAGLQTPEVQLARLPGAVFALVCTQTARAPLEQLREQVDALLSEPLLCGGQSVDVSLVHGLASAQPLPGMSMDDLLRRGELAVAQAKQHKQAWAWHVPQDAAARGQQLSLLSSLRDAAHNGQLELWLQPKHHIASGRLCGMEGLVRWRHPERGLVSPAEFIPFAERTGHIGLITQAMLRAALTQLAQWQDGAQQHLTLAVNVSADDVHDRQFVPQLQALAHELSAPLSQLRLEITESSAMQDAEQVLVVLHALRNAGVSLSIDDFGTGYSSLAYLSRLPVNELKIDRSFVDRADTQPGAPALLRTMIELGHSLGMEVTAEGVERHEELALLKALNCDVVQGYWLSKPLAPAAAQAYARAHTEDQAEALSKA